MEHKSFISHRHVKDAVQIVQLIQERTWVSGAFYRRLYSQEFPWKVETSLGVGWWLLSQTLPDNILRDEGHARYAELIPGWKCCTRIRLKRNHACIWLAGAWHFLYDVIFRDLGRGCCVVQLNAISLLGVSACFARPVAKHE